MLVKRHSDFLVLGFLSVGGFMGDLGLLLVNPSGVETIASIPIVLNVIFKTWSMFAFRQSLTIGDYTTCG